MRLFDLPLSLLLLLFSSTTLGATSTSTLPPFRNKTTDTQPVTTGPQYASACAASTRSYSSAYNSWSREHEHVRHVTETLGGTSYRVVTYYENATTLCDGYPRVTYSPAVSLSKGTITYPHLPTSTKTYGDTYYYAYPSASPTCTIQPSDCDPLWADYSASLTAWRQGSNATSIGTAPQAQITQSPQTPPCQNQSEASRYAAAASSIYGCGLCTIFGDAVELVYFPVPTTVSRDMCATTPSTSLTHYGPGAVIEAYQGTQYGANATMAPGGAQTAVVGHNTFTSGTAYISIGSVWAENRCSSTIGTPVSNAILAMPSESVLSLRYRQDHFQYFAVTSTQTGYPVSYADFNSPVPYSAWIGQEKCEGYYDTWYCGVIYENDFRPQLAIPPEIRQLNPAWDGCQMWYGGLYDPPLALQPAESIALPTRPHPHDEVSKTPEPSSTVAAPTSTATALPDQGGNAEEGSTPEGGHSTPSSQDEGEGSVAAPTSTAIALPDQGGDAGSWSGEDGEHATPPSQVGVGQATPTAQNDGGADEPQGSWHHVISAGGLTWEASACGGHACIDGTTFSAGGPAQTLSGGAVASYDSESHLHVQGSSTIALPHHTTNYGVPGVSRPGEAPNAAVTIAGNTVTAVQTEEGGAVIVDGSRTLTPGGAATTLADGQVFSAENNGLVVGWSSSFEVDAVAAEATASGSNGRSGSGGDAQGTGAIVGASGKGPSISVTVSSTIATQPASTEADGDSASERSTSGGSGSGTKATGVGEANSVDGASSITSTAVVASDSISGTAVAGAGTSTAGAQYTATATGDSHRLAFGRTHALLVAVTLALAACGVL